MSDEQEKSQLVSTWGDVEKVIKQNAFPKWAGRTLGVIVALVVLLAGFAFWNVNRINDLVTQNHTLVQQVKAGAVSSCQAGNKARATNVKIWDEFIGLLINNPNAEPTREFLISSISALNLPANEVQAFTLIIDKNWSGSPADRKTAAAFEKYIADNEKAQNCSKVYNGGASSTQAYSMRIPARG